MNYSLLFEKRSRFYKGAVSALNTHTNDGY